MKLKRLTCGVLLALGGQVQANEVCSSEVYGVNLNAGSSVVKITPTTGQFALHSSVLQYSDALAYQESTDRLYYVTKPVNGKPRLVYVDMATEQHVDVAATTGTYRLAFSPDGQTLWGSSEDTVFNINTNDGTVSNKVTLTGFATDADKLWGDIVFINDTLHIVTNKKLFAVDLAAGTVREVGMHNLSVTGSTIDSLGQLLVSSNAGNNKTDLYTLDPATAKPSLLSSINYRINDLATRTYVQPACTQLQDNVSSVEAIKNNSVEGQVLHARVHFEQPISTDTVTYLNIENASAQKNADFDRFVELSFDNGMTWTSVKNISTIATTDAFKGLSHFDVRIHSFKDGDIEGNENFVLEAWNEGQADKKSRIFTIVDQDSSSPDVTSVTLTSENVPEGVFMVADVVLSQATTSEFDHYIQLVTNSENPAYSALNEDFTGQLEISFNRGISWQSIGLVGELIKARIYEGVSEYKLRAKVYSDGVTEGAETAAISISASSDGLFAIERPFTINDAVKSCLPKVMYTIALPNPFSEDGYMDFEVGYRSEAKCDGQYKFELVETSISYVDKAKKGVDFSTLVDIKDINSREFEQFAVDASGVVTIDVPKGSAGFVVRVYGKPDDIIEGPEEFSINAWASPDQSDLFFKDITILDGDNITPSTSPNVSLLSINPNPAAEGQTARITVSLEKATTVIDSVLNVKFNDVEAISTEDYNNIAAVSFDVGATWQSVDLKSQAALLLPIGTQTVLIDVATKTDDEFETSESTMFSAWGQDDQSDFKTRKLTITDMTTASISLSSVTGNVVEGQQVELLLRLNQALNEDATIYFAPYDGTAKVGQDFSAYNYTITLEAGKTDYSIFINTTDDLDLEDIEYFDVQVTGLVNVSGSQTLRVFINDNEQTPTMDQVRALATSVKEGDEASFAVSLTHALNAPTLVSLSLTDDSAKAGDDFASIVNVSFDNGVTWSSTTLPNTVEVPAQVSEFIVKVTTIRDTERESTEEFSLKAWTTSNASDIAQASGTITDNGAPIATDDSAEVNEDSLANNIDVLGNDSDPENDKLTVASATSNEGVVQINTNGTLNFQPDTNFNGIATITYVVVDEFGGEDTAYVSVNVIPVNDAPIARPDLAKVSEDSQDNIIVVLSNDEDIDKDTLSVTSASANNGTVIINIDGTVTYTPNANFNGTDTISYSVSDGKGGSASSTVTVTVDNQNDAPTAAPFTAIVDEDSLNNVIDVSAYLADNDNDTLTLSSPAANNGVVTVVDNGKLTYTPKPGFVGSDTITYTVSDGKGGTAQGVITMTVKNVNDAPVAKPKAVEVNENSQNNIITLADVLEDADNDVLTVTNISAQHGTVTLQNGQLVYTPQASYSGADEITYTVSDGKGGSAQGYVEVTIKPVNATISLIAVNGASREEGQTATYRIVLNQAISNDATIEVQVTNGTAFKGSDFSFTNTTMTVPAGQTSVEFNVVTIEDSTHEELEDYNVKIIAKSNATGTAQLKAVIVDDDCLPAEYTRINYRFISESAGWDNDWGIKVDGKYTKLLDERGASGSFDVPLGKNITYVLARDGKSNDLTTDFKWNGTDQRWEDTYRGDADYNDFVVNVTTAKVSYGCK
ncbi:Ig-like domain-containing protein [Pseudoalteromonas tunicata]|uniref:Ig-like domain-containing protein n=1 Tax=Pseudoalteromonas tunicata TaxID=314281 RepID=UPI00273D6C70|nr:cadherin-like domain-containing protein [Pseudoalteromonas tunicata]MDP4984726.1 Ig-like domain-containing protein [Pseudoalteromonas tunicata]